MVPLGFDSNTNTHTHTGYLTTYVPGERLFNSYNATSNTDMPLLPPLSIEESGEKTKSRIHIVSHKHTHGHTSHRLICISFWDQRKIYISSGGAEVFVHTLSLFVIRPNPCGSPNHAVRMCPCVCRLRPWPRVRTCLQEVSRSEGSGRWIRAGTHLGPN